MTTTTVFFVCSFLLLISAAMVILSKHPVFSLLFLLSCFLFSSVLLLLLECEFLALLFIVVYVGAIAVLFLFAIMMLESKSLNLSRNVMKYIPVGLFFLIFLLFPVFTVVGDNFTNNVLEGSFYMNEYQNWYDLVDSVTDIEVYGHVLYSYFVFHFLISGLILLVVLIGVVYLTNTFNNDQILEQHVSKQLSRNSRFFFKN